MNYLPRIHQRPCWRNKISASFLLVALVFCLSASQAKAVTFSSITLPGTSGNTYSVAWGDYDGDGDLDFAAGNYGGSDYLARNNGGDSFTVTTITDTAGSNSYGLAWCDLDNDGDLDLAVAVHNGHPYIAINNAAEFSTMSVYGTGNPGAISVACGDFDNDGDFDLAFAPTAPLDDVLIAQNTGGLTFSTFTVSFTPTATSVVRWGDYDNDGDLDLLMGSQNVADIVARNDGGRAFTSVPLASQSSNFTGTAEWVDYNNDGDLDIAVFNALQNQPDYIMNNDPLGTFTKFNPTNFAGDANGSSFADYDLDSYLDTAITRGTAVDIILFSSSISSFTHSTTTLQTGQSLGNSAGDYDQDGDLDILISINGAEYIARNNIAVVNSSPTAPTNGFSGVFQQYSASSSSGVLTLQWNSGADAETITAGLNYLVRVGTSSGNEEILPLPNNFGLDGYRGAGTELYSTRISTLGQRGLKLVVQKGATYYWAAYTVDASRYRGPPSAEQSVYVAPIADTTPPTSAITQPVHLSSTNTFLTVSGTAADTSGISQVEVRITRLGDNYVWNASSFVPGTSFLSATGTTNWAYTAVPSTASLTNATTYQIEARATDGAANLQIVYTTNTFVYNTSVTSTSYGFTGNFNLATGVVYDSGGKDESKGILIDTITAGGPFIYTVGLSSVDAGGYDVFIAKLDSNGTSLSSTTFDSSNAEEHAESITQDAAGNIYVTGWTGSTSTSNVLVLKYDKDLVFLASATWDGAANNLDEGRGIVAHSNGDIYVTGRSFDGSSFEDIVLLRYTSNLGLVTASPWAAPGGGNDFGWGITEDTLGNLIVTGRSFVSGSGDQFFLLKVSTGLTFVSSATWGNTSPQFGSASVVDNANNVFATGYSWNGTSNEIITLKYDSSLVFQSSVPLDTASSDVGRAITIDTVGDIIVAGQINNDQDLIAIKYNSSLTLLSSATFDGSAGHDDSGYGVAVGTDALVYVTGRESHVNPDNITLRFTLPATVPDTTPPTAAVTYPAHQASLTTAPTVSGTAADNIAVSSVTVLTRRLFDSRYWNGTTWDFSVLYLEATGTTNWTFTNGPSTAALTNGTTYQIFARAQDSSGNTFTTVGSSYTYHTAPADTTPPTSAITQPVHLSSTNTFLTVSGTAADASGLSQVEIRISRQSDGYVWLGGDFFAVSSFTVVSGTDAWIYSSVPTSGKLTNGTTYQIEARATDGASNLQIAYATNTFVYHAASTTGWTSVWNSSETEDTHGVDWGDFDNDGDLDFVAVNYNQTNRVYRNNGDGTFTSAWNSAETENTTCVAWGDFDNDGDLDFAVGNYSETNRVYRNNGDGTFTAAWSSSETENTYSVAWGDFDNDGDLDLATANNGSQTNRVYRNNGDGTFTSVWNSPETENTITVAWGDYDNDGDLDLAAGNYLNQTNRVYRNNGDATFTSAWNSSETEHTFTFDWGDFDNDGDLDLAAGNDATANRVYRNNGDGTFTVAWSSTETEATRIVSWGDYDNDGYLDMATGNWGQTNRVYHNEGDGTFTAAWNSPETDQTRSVAWADFDSDGDLDIVAGNYIVADRVYRGSFAGANTAPTIPSGLSGKADFNAAFSTITFKWDAGDYDSNGSTTSVYYAITVTTVPMTLSGDGLRVISPSSAAATGFIINGVHGAPFLGNYLRPAFKTWPGDGSPKHGVVLSTVPDNADSPLQSNTTYYFRVQTIDGGLAHSSWSTEASVYFSGLPSTLNSAPITNVFKTSITVNWTSSFSAGTLYYSEISTGALPNSFSGNSSSNTLNLSATFSDLNMGATYYAQVSTANAAPYTDLGSARTLAGWDLAWTSSESDDAMEIIWADYDNDGDLDQLSTNFGNQRIHKNNGDGTFTSFVAITKTDDSVSGSWGDYDNDGDLDPLIGNEDEPNRVYRNNGDDTFTLIWSSTETDSTMHVAWGDYDNDGFLDQLIGNNSTSPNRVYRNNGDGTFSLVWSSSEIENTRSAAWGDFDNDGDLDQLIGNRQNVNRVYRNNGDGTFTAVWASTESDYTYSAVWGDHDRDGDLDQLIGNIDEQNRVYRNNGDGTFTLVWSSSYTAKTHRAVWGDFDNDGYLDQLVGNLNQFNRIYRNNRDGSYTPVWVSSTSLSSWGVSWGDSDSDGDLDQLVANSNQTNRIYKSLEADSGNSNIAPSAPGGLSATVDYNAALSTVTFKWNAGDYDSNGSTATVNFAIEVTTVPTTLSGDSKRIISPSSSSAERFIIPWVQGSMRLGSFLRPAYKTWPSDGSPKHGVVLSTVPNNVGSALQTGTTYYYRVQAVDSGFAHSTWSAEASVYFGGPAETTPPTSAITQPVHLSSTNTFLTVSGTAADASGITQVEIRITRQSDSKVWLGGDFFAVSSFTVVTGTNNWTYASVPSTAALTTGTTYQIEARATDGASNLQIAYATNTFVYHTAPVAPSGTFSGDFSTAYGAVYDNGSSDNGHAVLVDTQSAGGPFIYSLGSFKPGSTTALVLAKYDDSGNLVTSTTFDSPGISDTPEEIARDGSGNIYITGWTGSTSSANALLVKYDSNLVFLASASYDSGFSNLDITRGLLVHSNGDIYLAGHRFDGSGFSDVLLLRYNSSLILVSSATFNSGGSVVDTAMALAEGSGGELFITGNTYPASDAQILILKASSNLTIISSATFGDAGTQNSYDIAIDASDNIYITGTENNTDYDILNLKYDSSLVFVSSSIFDAGDWDLGYAIEVDSVGDVVVAGTAGTLSNVDAQIIKYDSNWVMLSSASLNGSSNGNDSFSGVAVGSTTFAYATGLVKVGNNEMVTVRFNLPGSPPDSTSPTSAITQPVHLSSTNTFLTVSGTAADASGLTQVEVRITRLGDNYVWNASSFVPGTSFLNASGTTNWAYTSVPSTAALTDATTYQIEARATDPAGNLQIAYATNTFVYHATPPPTAPSGFTGTALSTYSIRWTWTDNSGDEDGFRVFSGTTNLSGDLAADTTFWVQTGLSANIMYIGKAQAFNVYGTTDSGQAGKYTHALVPGTPSETSVTTTTITMSWSANGNPAQTGYILQHSTGAGFFTIYTGTMTTFTDTGLTPSTTYPYQVQAYSGDAATTAFSSISSGTTTTPDTTPPTSAITQPVHLSTTNAFLTVSGTAADASGLTQVEIRITRQSDGFVWLGGDFFAVSSFTVVTGTDNWTYTSVPSTGALTHGTTYQIEARATDGAANLQIAYATNTFIYYNTPPPTAPSGFTGTALSTYSVRWTWTDNSSDEDGFRVLAGTINISGDLAADTTFWVQTGLSANTMYVGKAQAFNTNGTSDSGQAGKYTHALVPGTPSETSVTTTTITMSWSANGNPAGTGYILQHSTGAGFFTIYTGTMTTFTDTGLTPTTTYPYQVQAYSGDAATTAFSSISSGTTTTPDTTPPTSGITQPLTGISTATFSQIEGTASDNAGVSNVEVRISSGPGFSTYWTGTAWSGASAFLTASGTATWTYTAVPTNLNLVDGTTYQIEARAIDTSLNVEALYSTHTFFYYQTTPAIAPASFSGIPTGATSILWSWTDSASNETGYRVLSGTTSLSGNLSPGTSVWAQTGLSANTQYGPYRAAAVRYTTETYSSTAQVYTNAAAPTGTALTGVWATSATFAWNLGANPAATLADIAHSTSGVDFTRIAFATSTSHVQQNLLGCTTYHFRVRNWSGSGVATTYDSILSFATQGSTPPVPGSLSAQSLTGNLITLSWLPAPSTDVTAYKLYYDAGTGTIDYSTPLGVFTSTETSYTTGVLTSSASYRFGLRATNLCGVEEGNTSVLAAAGSIASLTGVSARIKVPQTGKRIKGNRVTIVAELIRGDAFQTRDLTFQYRTSTASAWTNIISANVNHPNPDTSAPWFVHWDVDALGFGVETLTEVRVLATDTSSVADTAPGSISITIVPVANNDVDVDESLSGGKIKKTEKLNKSVTNTIEAAEETSTQVTTLVIPPDTISLSTDTVEVTNNPTVKPPDPPDAETVGVITEIKLGSGQTQLETGKTAVVTLCFTDANDDGIEDTTGLRADRLRMYSASSAAGPWKQDLGSSIGSKGNCIDGNTTHFSFFALFAPALADLRSVRVYPNPFKPNSGSADDGVAYSPGNANSGIIIDQLPADSTLKIFTVTGSLVTRFSAGAGGTAQWDTRNDSGGEVASGLYIIVIMSPNQEPLIKKVLIVR